MTRRLDDDDHADVIDRLNSIRQDYYVDELLMDEAIESIEQLRADLKQAVDTIHGFARQELDKDAQKDVLAQQEFNDWKERNRLT